MDGPMEMLQKQACCESSLCFLSCSPVDQERPGLWLWKRRAAHREFRGAFCVPAHRVSGSGLVQELQGNLSPLMWEQAASSVYHLSPGNRGGLCCLQPMSYNWSSSSPLGLPSSMVYVLWFLSARKYAHTAYQIWNASTLSFIWSNKCIFRYCFHLHGELDVFGVFKCNFSGRCNNTFKLVVGDMWYFFLVKILFRLQLMLHYEVLLHIFCILYSCPVMIGCFTDLKADNRETFLNCLLETLTQ